MDNGRSFEPITDFPENVDAVDDVIGAGGGSHDQAVQDRRRNVVRIIAVVSAIALVVFAGFGIVRTVIAVAAAYAIFMTGIKTIGAFARPIPEALPPGELRRVKLSYRCDICGTELKLTLANEQVPEPPKHCTEPMLLVTNLEDIL